MITICRPARGARFHKNRGEPSISFYSNQLYPFTRLAVERMDPQQRIGLIEMLWEVAYADGVLDPEEDALLRRVAGLIYVSDADRVATRLRVTERLARKRP